MTKVAYRSGFLLTMKLIMRFKISLVCTFTGYRYASLAGISNVQITVCLVWPILNAIEIREK